MLAITNLINLDGTTKAKSRVPSKPNQESQHILQNPPKNNLELLALMVILLTISSLYYLSIKTN